MTLLPTSTTFRGDGPGPAPVPDPADGARPGRLARLVRRPLSLQEIGRAHV